MIPQWPLVVTSSNSPSAGGKGQGGPNHHRWGPNRVQSAPGLASLPGFAAWATPMRSRAALVYGSLGSCSASTTSSNTSTRDGYHQGQEGEEPGLLHEQHPHFSTGTFRLKKGGVVRERLIARLKLETVGTHAARPHLQLTQVDSTNTARRKNRLPPHSLTRPPHGPAPALTRARQRWHWYREGTAVQAQNTNNSDKQSSIT